MSEHNGEVERRLDRPTSDEYTDAWYRKQFLGLSHHFQRCLVEEAQLAQEVRLLRAQLAEMERLRKIDMAKIGEIQDRLDKASEAFAALKKQLMQ